MKLTSLKPNPNNPRTIDEEALEKLKRKIKRNPDGLRVQKIAYKDGIIIAGNQRYRAITELGLELKDEWFADLTGWTDEQVKEWLVTTNVSDGTWDYPKLEDMYTAAELEEYGVELPAHEELEEEVEEDEAPEVSDEPPVSQLGKIYQLGRHRVMCGDSTDKASVELLMNGVRADMVFTDPPYNVGYEYSEYDDNKSEGEYIEFLQQAIPAPPLVKKAIINNGNKKVTDMIMAFGRPKHIACWTKTNAGSPGTISSFSVWEPIFFYGEIKRKSGNDLFDYPIGNQKDTGGHTCPKPLKMCVDMINDFAEQDDIYDPFLGSGSTLIACEQTNRTCYGMELDPRYVDVIRKRYAKFTHPETWEESWQTITPAIK